jgi:hypothetical protein
MTQLRSQNLPSVSRIDRIGGCWHVLELSIHQVSSLSADIQPRGFSSPQRTPSVLLGIPKALCGLPTPQKHLEWWQATAPPLYQAIPIPTAPLPPKELLDKRLPPRLRHGHQNLLPDNLSCQSMSHAAKNDPLVLNQSTSFCFSLVRNLLRLDSELPQLD